MPEQKIAAQLYIFRDRYDLDGDLNWILEGLAASGYAAVEGFNGQPAGRGLLDRHGLGLVGPHLVLAALAAPDAVIADTLRAGGGDVVSSGLLEWEKRSAEDYRAAAEALNVAGRRLRERGLFLHYHNHDFEFEVVSEGRTGYDLLLDGLDPASVTLCVDTGWVWKAWQDPVELLRRCGDRVGMVHLRDWRAGRAVALGSGEMALGPVIEELPRLPNLRHIVVEQDPDSEDPMADMRASRAFLRERFSL